MSGRWVSLSTHCLFVASLILVGCDSDPKPGEKDKAKVSFQTNAIDLMNEFIKDSKSAEAKYKDKVVELEGKIAYAFELPNDPQTVTLRGTKNAPEAFEGPFVVCQPKQKDLNSVWWLGRHQKVRVVGKVTRGTSHQVNLTDCVFEELEPSPTPQVTATELTAEFLKDKKAAKKKYFKGEPRQHFQEMIVTGIIKELIHDKKRFAGHSVILQGKDPAVVYCRVGEKNWQTLKKGQSVIVKGNCSGFLVAIPGFPFNHVGLNDCMVLQKRE